MFGMRRKRGPIQLYASQIRSTCWCVLSTCRRTAMQVSAYHGYITRRQQRKGLMMLKQHQKILCAQQMIQIGMPLHHGHLSTATQQRARINTHTKVLISIHAQLNSVTRPYSQPFHTCFYVNTSRLAFSRVIRLF